MAESISSASSSGLTVEQLNRIEKNKRRAQELLKTKRKHPIQDGKWGAAPAAFSQNDNSLNPSQAKRPSVHHIHARDPHLNSPRNSHQSHFTKSGSSLPLQSSEPIRINRDPSSHFTTKAAAEHPPHQYAHSRYSSSIHGDHKSSTAVIAAPVALTGPQNAPRHYSTSSVHGSSSKDPIPGSSTASASSHGSGSGNQVLQLKKRIKANFVMLSKKQFKVMVPYDASVIEIFKKMNSRSYGGYTSLIVSM